MTTPVPQTIHFAPELSEEEKAFWLERRELLLPALEELDAAEERGDRPVATDLDAHAEMVLKLVSAGRDLDR